MNWKALFKVVGNEVAKAAIPGVAEMETAITGIKAGGQRQAAVLELIKGSLQLGTLSGVDLSDPELLEGATLVVQGNAKILRAIKRLRPGPVSLPVDPTLPSPPTP